MEDREIGDGDLVRKPDDAGKVGVVIHKSQYLPGANKKKAIFCYLVYWLQHESLEHIFSDLIHLEAF